MREIVRSDLGEGVLGHEVQRNDISVLKKLYWRGDSREPKEIFEFGLRRMDDTAESYFKRQKTLKKLAKPFNRFALRNPGKTLTPEIIKSKRRDEDIMAPTMPFFRTEKKDISPATAVCVASSFKAGALFPLVQENGEKYDKTWVYAVYLENGFNTFQMQVNIGADSAPIRFVQEACCNDIPPMHVIGAIEIERAWNSVINWQAGAKGYIENGTARQLFKVNPKSMGCVGRNALIEQAIEEISNCVPRFVINWK